MLTYCVVIRRYRLVSAYFNKYVERCSKDRECFRKEFRINIAKSQDELTFHELVVTLARSSAPHRFDVHFRPMVGAVEDF